MISFPVLRFAELTFSLIPKKPYTLPSFLGSTLRGALASAMKRITCVARRRSSCADCDFRQACYYAVLFETQRPQWAELMPKMETVVHPIVIEPPLNPSHKDSNEPIIFTVRLFGRATNASPFVIEACRRLAINGLGKDRYPFELEEVRDPSQQGAILYSKDNPEYGGYPSVRTMSCEVQSPPENLPLQFLTPTRLVEDGRLLRSPTVEALVRAIVFRIRAIGYFHDAKRWDPDIEALQKSTEGVKIISADTSFKRLERLSTRQQRKVPLDGFVGRITLAGETLGSLYPLFAAGQVLHIGKGTVFGLGWYKICGL